MATFTERAVDAVHDYLTEDATGLNSETLPALRTALGITTAELPDVASFEKWYHRADQARSFPYLSIVVNGTTGESSANSRMYSAEIDLGLVVLDANVSGDEAATMVATWRLGDAIKTIFNRRTGAGSEGWTLGGASGIIRATVDSQSVGADPTLSVPNTAILTRLTVVTSEEF